MPSPLSIKVSKPVTMLLQTQKWCGGERSSEQQVIWEEKRNVKPNLKTEIDSSPPAFQSWHNSKREGGEKEEEEEGWLIESIKHVKNQVIQLPFDMILK